MEQLPPLVWVMHDVLIIHLPPPWAPQSLVLFGRLCRGPGPVLISTVKHFLCETNDTFFQASLIAWRASRLTSWASHLFSFFYFIPLSCYSSGLFIYVTHIATSLCGKLPLFSELWLFEFIWPCLKLMSPSGWLRKILLITQLIQSWCPRYGPWTHLKETRTHSIAQFSRTAEDKQQWFNVSVNTVMLPSGQ